jgi:hypothetical protein
MTTTRILALAFIPMFAIITACGGGDTATVVEEPPQTTEAPTEGAADADVSFTEADLEQFERGLREEVARVQAAQKDAAAATDPQARGQAIQAQFETATIPQGAAASGLGDARYREVREAVENVFTLLDFQGKIDGPLSIDLERADEATRERVNADAFAALPEESAAALRARMDRLVPVWIEYKRLVAVAG